VIKHDEALQALRTSLLSLEVATTGLISLRAVADGFTRSSGSFVADRFAVGMEVTPVGFTTTAPMTILRVEDTKLTVDGAVTAQAAADNRKLTVGLPELRGWIDLPLEPVVGRPYFEEDYLFGPAEQPGVGPRSTVIGEPLYVGRFYVPSQSGYLASTRYARAFLEHFKPGMSLALATGDVVRVRTSPAPFAGQTQTRTDAPHWSQVAVTVPLRLSTVNSI